jgi:hypothetical protein
LPCDPQRQRRVSQPRQPGGEGFGPCLYAAVGGLGIALQQLRQAAAAFAAGDQADHFRIRGVAPAARALLQAGAALQGRYRGGEVIADHGDVEGACGQPGRLGRGQATAQQQGQMLEEALHLPRAQQPAQQRRMQQQGLKRTCAGAAFAGRLTSIQRARRSPQAAKQSEDQHAAQQPAAHGHGSAHHRRQGQQHQRRHQHETGQQQASAQRAQALMAGLCALTETPMGFGRAAARTGGGEHGRLDRGEQARGAASASQVMA